MLHQAQHVVATHPVIQRLGAHKPVAKLGVRGIKGRVGAQGAQLLGLLLVLGANVDIQVVVAQHALAVLRRLQVDGHSANHAGQLVLPNHHPLGYDDPGVDAAYRAEAQQPLLGVARDDKAHLVHVCGHHHGGRVGVGALFQANHVARAVNLYLVGQGLGCLHDGPAYSLLVARGSVQVG